MSFARDRNVSLDLRPSRQTDDTLQSILTLISSADETGRWNLVCVFWHMVVVTENEFGEDECSSIVMPQNWSDIMRQGSPQDWKFRDSKRATIAPADENVFVFERRRATAKAIISAELGHDLIVVIASCLNCLFVF